MQHLDTERIASFDHDAPTLEELAHLAACRLCRAERSALAELAELAMHTVDDSMTATGAPLTNWESLSVRLRAEGLITSAPAAMDVVATRVSHFTANNVSAAGTTAADTSRAQDGEIVPLDAWVARAKPRNRTEWWRAAAAALLLVMGGGALGRISAGATAMPGFAESSNAAAASVFGVSNLLGSTAFTSLDDANRVLSRAQRDYERAALWLAANDTTSRTSETVRRRLAALDQMVAASRAGLADSPSDPVLNHYYTSAYAMREATLQQLGGALPVGWSIERF